LAVTAWQLRHVNEQWRKYFGILGGRRPDPNGLFGTAWSRVWEVGGGVGGGVGTPPSGEDLGGGYAPSP